MLLILSIIVFAFLLLCITAIGAFVRFYNYELHDEGIKLKRIAGLLERQTISLNKSKVQGISIKQNVFAKLLNRVSFYFQQVHLDAGGIGKKQSFIIPMLKPDEWQQQLSLIYPDLVDKPLVFERVHYQYLIKRILYIALLPISLVALPLAILVNVKLLSLMAISIPLILIISLRYRKYGLMVLDDYLIIREGLIGTSYHILRRYKAQHLSEFTSPSQRRLGLATLKVQMAFKLITIPYVPIEKVNEIINDSIFLSETTNKNWM